jgi:hypothetical protein
LSTTLGRSDLPISRLVSKAAALLSVVHALAVR